MLYDARQLFDAHNAKADVLLRSVAGALPEAVATCLDAAGADLSPLRQAALLKVPDISSSFQSVSAAFGTCTTTRRTMSSFAFADGLSAALPVLLMTVLHCVQHGMRHKITGGPRVTQAMHTCFCSARYVPDC